MEPVSIGLGGLAWEYGVKPVVDSIKKEYGESAKTQLKAGLAKALNRLPFNKSELEVIEVEIVDASQEVLTDEKKFLDFINSNDKIMQILLELKKSNKDKIIIDSFQKLDSSEIKIDGKTKDIENSFKNVKDSLIDI